MLSVTNNNIMLSIIMPNVTYAECRYAECRYAGSRGADLGLVNKILSLNPGTNGVKINL
jgi:hypothetical protein